MNAPASDLVGPTADTSLPQLRAALQDAHAFWRNRCPRSWVPSYLQGRGLAGQIREAGLGHAPSGWTATLDHLRGHGHDDHVILAAGLAFTARTGHLVDTFRDRLIVPVTDHDRQLVGFLARRSPTAGDDIPKYLNSPATALYRKGELLYALGEDRDQLQRGALPVIVEGPMDRLAVRVATHHIAAVGLAPCGTALTHDQVVALVAAIGADRPIAVCNDTDTAGRQATLRAWDTLTAPDSPARGHQLLHIDLHPHGKDPAALIQAGHGDLLRSTLIRPRPLALAIADIRIAEAGDLDHVGRRMALLDHLIDHDLPAVHPSSVARYLIHVASRLTLPHTDVTRAVVERHAPAQGSADPQDPGGGSRTDELIDAFTARSVCSQGYPHGASPRSGPSLTSRSVAGRSVERSVDGADVDR